MVRSMKKVMPWLQPSDLPAMRAYCELEYICAAAFNALTSAGLFDKEGGVRRLGHDYRKFRATQAMLMRELGMTPVARAALKAGSKDQPFDLVGAFARDMAEEGRATKAIEAKPAKADESGDR